MFYKKPQIIKIKLLINFINNQFKGLIFIFHNNIIYTKKFNL